ncbi:hypothetical protein CAEBREN_19820 [Caenorhabditis brenneri]|uniref:DUF38 domain-containing protein n=1 Tax=Caenorhabditis brenneri TaxID=135651 RepID=G0N5A9_CAEBE|nr:hypothetical protein CAEBREN_19820 [Caenorhabditis brenneri]
MPQDNEPQTESKGSDSQKIGKVFRKSPVLQEDTVNLCFDIRELHVDFRYILCSTKMAKVEIMLHENGNENIWRWQIFNDHVLKEKLGDVSSRVKTETNGTALENAIIMINTIGERSRSIMEKVKVFDDPPPINLHRRLKAKILEVDNLGHLIPDLGKYFNFVDVQTLKELWLSEQVGDTVGDCLDDPLLKQCKLSLVLGQYNFQVLQKIVSNHVKIEDVSRSFTVGIYAKLAEFFSETKPIGFVFEMKIRFENDFVDEVMYFLINTEEWASKFLCKNQCATIIHHDVETVIYKRGCYVKLEIMKPDIATWDKVDCNPDEKCPYCSFRASASAQGSQDDKPAVERLE